MKITKGLKTKEKIIEIATKHFFQFGLYEVTYQGIATEAGLTQPAIYRHFQSMDDLFLAACQHWDAKAREVVYEDSRSLAPATTQLKNYVERHFTYTAKNRSHDSLVFGLYYYSIRSKKMFAYYSELRSSAVKNLEVILKFGNIDGSWKVRDTASVAETTHSLIAGEIFKFLIQPMEESVTKRSARVLSAIKKIIR
ncbi:MAG: TetR/AcrR family transcriptional regulator [Deltaproteobacteria bacterium]|jgi:AcrR family transcriptional regulator|nr:TetR/AcrR family transcriptional regulator [Deltaproteobacteria bacterium]